MDGTYYSIRLSADSNSRCFRIFGIFEILNFSVRAVLAENFRRNFSTLFLRNLHIGLESKVFLDLALVEISEEFLSNKKSGTPKPRAKC